ncbi:MAG: hypothetical protein ACI9R3_000049 [Verrucomicrobiales bacterium]|jgi:hypothetical protein
MGEKYEDANKGLREIQNVKLRNQLDGEMIEGLVVGIQRGGLDSAFLRITRSVHKKLRQAGALHIQ